MRGCQCLGLVRIPGPNGRQDLAMLLLDVPDMRGALAGISVAVVPHRQVGDAHAIGPELLVVALNVPVARGGANGLVTIPISLYHGRNVRRPATPPHRPAIPTPPPP